jgi:hypothetical protein
MCHPIVHLTIPHRRPNGAALSCVAIRGGENAAHREPAKRTPRMTLCKARRSIASIRPPPPPRPSRPPRRPRSRAQAPRVRGRYTSRRARARRIGTALSWPLTLPSAAPRVLFVGRPDVAPPGARAAQIRRPVPRETSGAPAFSEPIRSNPAAPRLSFTRSTIHEEPVRGLSEARTHTPPEPLIRRPAGR